jgi:hypothetical protein
MLRIAGTLNLRSEGFVAIALFAAALVLGMSAALAPRGTAEAAVVTFEVQMIGANEVPAASSPGYGFARFTFNDQTRELTYAVWMSGLSPNQVTASHIHRAPAGTAGPAIYTLAAEPFTSISGSVTLTEADVSDLRAGNLYVNIHSTTNPAGFARGQLKLPSAPAAAPGPVVRPPNTGDGGLAGSDSDQGWQLGLIAVAALALGATGVAARALRRA